MKSLFNKIKNMAKTHLEEKEITIVIASYNNKKWYKKNLDSVFEQKYNNYKIIYIDDCSPDQTGNLVEEYIKDHPQKEKVLLIKNSQRLGATANRYKASHLAKDKSIVAILDGDDWLNGPNVLTYINKIYSKKNIWVTYGQFRIFPSGELGHCQKMPKNYDFSQNGPFFTSHLRTYYAWLFKGIPLEKLQINEKFPEMAGDVAEMLSLLLKAKKHLYFSKKILYIYNKSNPINDAKINLKKQLKIAELAKKKSSSCNNISNSI